MSIRLSLLNAKTRTLRLRESKFLRSSRSASDDVRTSPGHVRGFGCVEECVGHRLGRGVTCRTVHVHRHAMNVPGRGACIRIPKNADKGRNSGPRVRLEGRTGRWPVYAGSEAASRGHSPGRLPAGARRGGACRGGRAPPSLACGLTACGAVDAWIPYSPLLPLWGLVG